MVKNDNILPETRTCTFCTCLMTPRYPGNDPECGPARPTCKNGHSVCEGCSKPIEWVGACDDCMGADDPLPDCGEGCPCNDPDYGNDPYIPEEDPWFASVTCPEHGELPLSYQQYSAQMADPDSTWKCPTCGKHADFDDGYFETRHEQEITND